MSVAGPLRPIHQGLAYLAMTKIAEELMPHIQPKRTSGSDTLDLQRLSVVEYQ